MLVRVAPLVHVLLAQVLIGAGSGTEPLAWSTQAVRRNPTQQSSVQFEGKRSPVLVKTDLLFVGSSLDACFLASDLAKSGKSTVLASAGSSLPHELTMCMRPWVRQEDLASAPPEIRQFLSKCIRQRVGDGQLLDMMKVTEGLEDRILNSGAGLFYDLFPCGVELTADRVSAVVFACKGGLVAIEAKRVVDCTPEALVVTLAGGETKLRDSAKSGLLARYTLLCGEPTESRTLTAEGVSELIDDQVIMHGEFAEFRMRIPVSTSPLPDAKYGLEARRITAEVGRAVRVKAPKTHFVRGGNSILIDPARHIVSGSPSRGLSARACRPKGLENVWVLTHCLAVGAVVDGRRLTGVVITTPDGLGVIQANLVIDATGDGDVAARAGVATEYGTRRDSMTAWFSFGRFHGTNRCSHGQFDCVVDPRDPVDMTRAMITARRRSRKDANSFPQYYLIQRESRRRNGSSFGQP